MLWMFVAVMSCYMAYTILRQFGVFESSVGTKQHDNFIEERARLNKKRKFENAKLDIFQEVTRIFKGVLFSSLVEEEHKYFIERLNIRSEVLGRFLTPEEIRGKFILILFAGIMCIPLTVLNPLFVIVVVLCILIFVQYKRIYIKKIEEEDDIIDKYFIDLYLLMYSKLRMGSKGRLASVVESYIDTLKNSTADARVKSTMLRMAEFLLNNLSMYPDDRAVPMLRERYRSATIVNFCNVATQALQGIDNADTLLTTKMELVKKKTDLMHENAEKLRRKGEMSIYLIYVILFIFIASGWYSKLAGVTG